MDADRRPNDHPEKRPRRASTSPRSSHLNSNMKRHNNRYSPPRNHYRPQHPRDNYRGAPPLPPRGPDRDNRRGPRPRDYPPRNAYEDRFRAHPPPPHLDADRNRPAPHNNYKSRYNDGPDRRFNHPPPRDTNRGPRNYQPFDGNSAPERRFSHPPPSRDGQRDAPRNPRDFPPHPHSERLRFPERNPPRGRFHEQEDRYRGPPPQPRRSLPEDRYRGPPPPPPRQPPPDDRYRGYRRDDGWRNIQRPRTESRTHLQALAALEDANRFVHDTDENFAVILSALEFSENREAVIERVQASLMKSIPSLRIRCVYPVGRRNGHCFVVFDDQESKIETLRMGTFPVISSRNAIIHPLERPYLVAFREGSLVNIHELESAFNIGGIRDVSTKIGQRPSDLIHEVPTFQALVRVLCIDGFQYGNHPHVAVRCYSRTPAKPSGYRRKNDEDVRRQSQREWRVRFRHVPESISLREVYSFLEKNNIRGVRVDRTGSSEVTVFGESFDGDNLYNATYELRNHDFANGGIDEGGDSARKRAPPSDAAGGAPPPPAKKLRPDSYISPLTPPTPPKKIKNEDVEPRLKAVGERLQRMQSAITSQKVYRPKTNLDEFCRALPSYRSEQKTPYSEGADDDLALPRVWTGNIRMGRGQHGNADAHVIWREDQDDEQVKQAMKLFPESLEITHRIDHSDPGFAHLLHRRATVFLVRGNKEETDTNLSLPQRLHQKPTSRSVILGIVKYLLDNKKVGLIRYTTNYAMDKMSALVVAPTDEVLEKLNIPWRIRDVILHDSLLVVLGPKARSAALRSHYRR